MADRLAEIRSAIDRFQMDEARTLVADELAEQPSAEAHYLAAQAALSQGERLQHLEMALELDPAHELAAAELTGIRRPEESAHEPPEPADSPSQMPEQAPAESDNHAPKLASLLKRGAALCIDGFIVALFSLAFMAASDRVTHLYEAMATLDEDYVAGAIAQFQADAVPVNLVVSGLYNVILMTVFNGQTMGKIVFGMRVVKRKGGRITVLDAFVRNVLGYTISQIFLLGYLWAWLDDNQQAWHDRLAGTIVIDERAGRRG